MNLVWGRILFDTDFYKVSLSQAQRTRGCLKVHHIPGQSPVFSPKLIFTEYTSINSFDVINISPISPHFLTLK